MKKSNNNPINKENNETEIKHWADSVVDQIIEVFGDKKLYVCATGISPSGTVHFGNFRETITTDIVVKALEHARKKAKLLYFWDDFDRFRKVPGNIKVDLNDCIGMPYSKIKDPFDCHESYGEHFEKEYEESLKLVNVKPKFVYQHKQYGKGHYAEDIKFVLDNRKKIREILNRYREKELEQDWWPINVYCENCNKDIPKIIKYDGNYSISYKCVCGKENTIDFRENSIVKLKWRVDWPMRWNKEKVDFEPAGKEHSTPGGSRTTANDIIKEIWNREPPIHRMYDFIIIKGKGGKMSGSLGNVISLNEVLEIYEPSIVRYMFAGTRPNTEFFVSFDLDVLKVYEDFDRCERIFFDKNLAKSDKEHINQKRIYELSAIDIPDNQPIQPIFRHLCNLLQVYENDFEQIKKYYEKELKTKFDIDRLNERCKRAWNWIQKYAPEDMKFQLQKQVNIKFEGKQKSALLLLKEKLWEKDYDEKELFNEFYNILKETGIEPPEFFKAAYKLLIGKEKGPKLAGFILAIGKERVLELLEKV